MLFSTFLGAGSVSPAAGSAPSGTSSYLFAEVKPFVQPGANITVLGNVINASNPPNGYSVGNVNVTVTLSTGERKSQIAGANGFNINITAPQLLSSSNSYAPYDVYVTDNTTETHNKTFFVYFSNATNITFAFVDSFPPFSTGRNATINLSYFNGSSPIVGGKPLVEIFKMNGIKQNWVVTNLSATTNAQGNILYNVTIPADASGQYGLAVDKGFGFMVFGIRSAYVVSFKVEATDGQRRGDFAPASAVNLVGLVRTSANLPYSLSGADNARAFVTLPNGTIVTTTLLARDSVLLPGVVNSTFGQTDLTGRYNVRLVVTIGTSSYETLGYFEIGSMTATLEAGNSFFEKFGDKRVILPNSTIEFSVLAINSSSGSLLNGSVAATANDIWCNQANVTFIGYTNLITGANVTNYSQFEPGMPVVGVKMFTPRVNVCSIRLKAPSNTGVYRISVNVTGPQVMGRPVFTATAVVSVETIMLRARPIQAAGRHDPGEFSFNLPPGENATFQLVAYNFSSGQPLNPLLIQNITIESIAPMSFFGGVSNPYNNFSINGTGVCGPCGRRPNPGIPYYISRPDASEVRLTVTLPDISGFFEGVIRANVSGQFVTTRAQFMVKRLEGGAMPLVGDRIPGQPGPGGPGEQGPDFGNGQTACKAGNVTMFAMASDIKTGQPAQGVQINPNILQAFDESTGRNIASKLRIDMRNSTNSMGQMTFNLTLAENLGNGFYPIEFNVTYRGRDESFFGMLNCRDNSNSKSLVIGRPAGSNSRSNFPVFLSWSQFFVAEPTGYRPIVNGTLEITGAVLFNEQERSMRYLPPNASLPPIRVNISQNMADVSLSPSNFSLLEWPVGKYALQLNVTNGSKPGPFYNEGPSFVVGDGPGQFFGGFEITSFEVFVTSNLMAGVFAGEPMSIRVNVSSNVSTSGRNFTLAFERYGFGNVIEPVVDSARLVTDAWNMPIDPDWEDWEVNFTVPAGLEPGFVGLTVAVNNSLGLESQTRLGMKISKFTVLPLLQHKLSMEGFRCEAYDDGNQNGSFGNCGGGGPGGSFNYENATHMNLSRLNTTYSIASKSGQVCLKRAFNYTQLTDSRDEFGMLRSWDNGTILVVIDNTTPFVYDTLVLNTSNGTQQIIFAGNFTSANRRIRGNTTLPYTDFYVANIYGCNMVTIVNGTQTPIFDTGEGYLGAFFRNDRWYAPFRILRGQSAVQANLTIASYAARNQNGNVEGELDDTGHVTTATVTDANGVGFVQTNVTQWGRYSALWDVNFTRNGVFVSGRAGSRSDGNSEGGGMGPEVQIRSYFVGVSPVYAVKNNPNFNVSFTFDVRDRNNFPVGGLNMTVNLLAHNNYGPPMVTPARLFNSTHVIVPRVVTNFAGFTGMNVTHPTGWPCNQPIELQGNLSDDTGWQMLWLGQAERRC